MKKKLKKLEKYVVSIPYAAYVVSEVWADSKQGAIYHAATSEHFRSEDNQTFSRRIKVRKVLAPVTKGSAR